MTICEFNGDIKRLTRNAGLSIHAGFERNKRFSVIKGIDNNPKFIKSWIVDNGHKNGDEIHVLSSEGIIYIYNKRKLYRYPQNSLVTAIIARPNQVKRYYDSFGEEAPKNILEKCALHRKMRLNAF